LYGDRSPCVAGRAHRQHGADALRPQVLDGVGRRAQLGQSWRRLPGVIADELEQQLGAGELDRVRHRHAHRPQPAEGRELRGRPLLGDQGAAEARARRHRPCLARLANAPTLEVAGVAVEQPVVGWR
jgi:hypothetical protein